MNNKDKGLERMTLEGLVKTLRILVEQRHGVPLATRQEALEDALADNRKKRRRKKR